jgi:hypothetical protein
MSRLSEKYIAGFLDADGCISVNFKKGLYKPLLGVSFSQQTSRDEVLLLIRESIGGGSLVKQTVKEKEYSQLVFSGSSAMALLSRIAKYLVVKKHYAYVCMELVKSGKPIDPIEGRKYLKEQRKIESLPLPNYPSRKWMAGYFDGDGNFNTSVRSYISKANSETGFQKAVLYFNIASSSWDTEGLKLIQRAFGGTIYHLKGDTHVLRINMQPSKAKEMLNHFGKYLILKKEQADYILSCANIGHYPEGKSMIATMKQLVAHEHRLSMSDAEYNKRKPIIDDPYRWKALGLDGCKTCGTIKIRHNGLGMCRHCYDVYYRSKAA